jgi:hypothetical protein
VTLLAPAVAIGVGIALSAYPVALATAGPGTLVPGGLALVCLALTLLFGNTITALAAVCLWALEYTVALLTGHAVLDPYAALFGAGWVLAADALFALSSGPTHSAPEAARRGLLYSACVAFVACVIASITELAGTIVPAGGVWGALLAVACSIGALVLLGGLAARALGKAARSGPGVGS